MSPEQWATFLTVNTFWKVACVVGGIFFIRHFWPWFKGEWADWKLQRRTQTQGFVDFMRSHDVLYAESQAHIVSTLAGMTKAIENLAGEVRHNKKPEGK